MARTNGIRAYLHFVFQSSSAQPSSAQLRPEPEVAAQCSISCRYRHFHADTLNSPHTGFNARGCACLKALVRRIDPRRL